MSTLRTKIKHRRLLAAGLVGLFLALLLAFGTGPYGWINMIRIKHRQAKLQRELLVTMARNELLRREIRRLTQDSLYLESKARERYGMVKPGEISIRFYPADSLRMKP